MKTLLFVVICATLIGTLGIYLTVVLIKYCRQRGVRVVRPRKKKVKFEFYEVDSQGYIKRV
ncbi:MAG: hypothetical protein PHW00_06325 [Clostridia bacterium]|nr:hypothetical protein [Clostridia bacterium]